MDSDQCPISETNDLEKNPQDQPADFMDFDFMDMDLDGQINASVNGHFNYGV